MGLQCLEVFAAFVTEIIQNDGSICCNLAANWAFAVQNPHRILFQTALTGIAEVIFIGCKISTQCLVIVGTAGRTADGIDVELNIFQTNAV